MDMALANETTLFSSSWETTMPTTASPSSCECVEGLLLPIFDECDWPKWLRGLLYFVGLLYIFFGVAIAADVFMSAIERITSQTRTVRTSESEFGSVDDVPGRMGRTNLRQVRIWNPTVANLTLMALGSSAPEILLSLIEIAGNDFKAGALGPSTIVGSAAFNLLVITAVCIVAIPNNETRKIEQLLVFGVTSFFSIFAYLWLLLILKAVTKEKVYIWEAVVTLLLFIVLVLTAYFADRKFFITRFKNKTVPTTLVAAAPTVPVILNGDADHVKDDNWKEQLNQSPIAAETAETELIKRNPSRQSNYSKMPEHLEVQRQLAIQYPDASAQELARLVAEHIDSRQAHPRSYYRIKAGNSWLVPVSKKPTYQIPVPEDETNMRGASAKSTRSRPRTALSHASIEHRLAFPSTKLAIIEFAAEKYAAKERDKVAQVKVVRTGRLNRRVIVRYDTLDGTAMQGNDYLGKSDLVIFNPDETEKLLNIDLVADKEHEPDEMFYIKLSLEDYAEGKTMIGKNNITQVTIIDHTKDPRFQFTHTSLVVKESNEKVYIPITLKGGVQDIAGISWKTVDGTAVAGKDYVGTSGTLQFGPGEIEKSLEIEIIDDKEYEKHESFSVVLLESTGGISVSSKKNRCVVTILNDDEMTLLLTQADRLVEKQLESLQPGQQTWKQQFVAAANVNGGDIEGAKPLDYVLHIITFAWKMIFACVPPAYMCGGWLTFIIALALIGLLTAIVGDLASIFGCIVGLEPTITAITLVAVGTSLPDLFASKLAATQEPTADNSIGNVTGSNSVNVFLGLGISWLAAAVYWSKKDEKFDVPAETLAFSVTIYCIVAALCIALLIVRRVVPIFGKAELGGNVVGKWLSAGFLVTLWVLYLLLSILQANGVIKGF